jgi:hypothetical protein
MEKHQDWNVDFAVRASCCYAFQDMARPKKNPVSEFMSKNGKKGGAAGTGKSKARTPEQARKAQAAGVEARRKKKEAQTAPKPEDEASL